MNVTETNGDRDTCADNSNYKSKLLVAKRFSEIVTTVGEVLNKYSAIFSSFKNA